MTNNYDINRHVTTQMTQGATNKLWQVFASGWQTTAIDPMGGQQNYFFDDQSRQTGFQDAMCRPRPNFYDGQDHVVQTISPLNETSQFIYDGSNNLIETIDPLGYSNVFTFDTNNNLIASTDARKNQPFRLQRSIQLNRPDQRQRRLEGFPVFNPNGTLYSRQD